MSTHNICFHGELRKIFTRYPLLSRPMMFSVYCLGIVAGGGRIDKPMLKAGRAYHKYKAKRNCWPKVRGVAMNVSISLDNDSGFIGRVFAFRLGDCGFIPENF